MARTLSEANRERRWADAERRKAERERYRERQNERRERIKKAAQAKRAQLERAREMCKQNAKHARDVAREAYRRRQALARAERERINAQATAGCRGSKQHIRDTALGLVAEAKRQRAEDKRQRAQLASAEAAARKRNRSRSTAAEKRSESDDAVRANIAPENQALWNRVKGRIRESSHRSRTEAFEHYLHENPSEAMQARERAAERAWKRDVAERQRQDREQYRRRRA